MAGLGSAPNDRGTAGRAREHAMVLAAALTRQPAYRRDRDFACDVSRPSPYLWRPPGYRESALCAGVLSMRARIGGGQPMLLAA